MMPRAAALLLLFAAGARSQTAPPPDAPEGPADAPAPATPAGRRAMWSRSQRFAAIGSNPGELIELLIWAEDFADRLAQFVGRPLPLQRAAPFEFHIEEDASALEGRVLVRDLQGLGGWSQRMHIVNPAATDPADVLDAFSALLLFRYVRELQAPAGRGAPPARVSDWWAQGVARQALAGARSLSQREVLREWDAGRCLALDRLLTPRPPDAVSALDKAYAAAAVGWLKSRKDFPDIADGLLRRWAAGRADDAEFLAERFGFPSDWRAMEMEWELWIAALRARQSQFMPATAGDLRALRERLTLRRTDLPPGAPDDLPARIPLELLAARRDEAWARAAARRILGAAVRLKYGRGAELRAVVDEYAAFLSAVARYSPATDAGPLTRWSDGRRLRRRLAAAEAALARLEARVAARPAPAASGTAPPENGPAAAEMERRALMEILYDAAREKPGGGDAPRNPFDNRLRNETVEDERGPQKRLPAAYR